MKQRVITAVIALIVLGVLLFAMPPLVVRIAIAVLVVAGAWEWSGLLGHEGRGARLAFVAWITGLLAAISIFLAGWSQEILLVSLGWWFLALLWIFVFPTPVPQPIRWLIGTLVLVPMYVALMLLYDADPMILLFALLIVWVADSGSYFSGRALGRIKLAPQISPG